MFVFVKISRKSKTFAKIFVFQTFSRKCKTFKKIFVIVNIFAKLSRKCWFSKHYCEKTNKNVRFLNIFAKDTFSKNCHVLAVLSRLPIGRHVQSDLSLLSCPSCPVPDVLSKTAYRDLSVLSQLSCPTYPPTPLTCPGSPVISVLSRLTASRLPVRPTC